MSVKTNFKLITRATLRIPFGYYALSASLEEIPHDVFGEISREMEVSLNNFPVISSMNLIKLHASKVCNFTFQRKSCA